MDLGERLRSAAAEAAAWDDRAAEMRTWPNARLEAAEQEVQALIERLEALDAEVLLSSGDDDSVTAVTIALREAQTTGVWIEYLLHSRQPPAGPLPE